MIIGIIWLMAAISIFIYIKRTIASIYNLAILSKVNAYQIFLNPLSTLKWGDIVGFESNYDRIKIVGLGGGSAFTIALNRTTIGLKYPTRVIAPVIAIRI
jgi:hypothetical protein